MLTKKDIQDLKEVFVTREEFYDFREEVYERFDEVKETIIQFKDAILTEIKAMREELIVVTGYRQHLENHEERITLLKSKSESVNLNKHVSTTA
jgi:hypothetical protein